MTNMIWILVIANIGYLVYALSKAKKAKDGDTHSVASETRSLMVPDETLFASPVALGKKFTIKNAESVDEKNPWGKKIYRNGGTGDRTSLAHNQLRLKDIDSNLSI